MHTRSARHATSAPGLAHISAGRRQTNKSGSVQSLGGGRRPREPPGGAQSRSRCGKSRSGCGCWLTAYEYARVPPDLANFVVAEQYLEDAWMVGEGLGQHRAGLTSAARGPYLFWVLRGRCKVHGFDGRIRRILRDTAVDMR